MNIVKSTAKDRSGLQDGAINANVAIGRDNTVVALKIGSADSSLYDVVTLTGGTTLAGSLEVELIDSFLPLVDNTFSLFSLEPDVALQGNFNDILLPDLPAGGWDTSRLLSDGKLCVGACLTGSNGNVNNDGYFSGVEVTLDGIGTQIVDEGTWTYRWKQ